ncbi:ATP-binding protein [Acetobacter senegalensis]|uniref:ATP-binding protein n=1 Tax=Acetobacter senegalensis TaxID=446692 RepID=UPI00263F8B3C|nr:ATP-binding protein [Acetobacter senegalensis]
MRAVDYAALTSLVSKGMANMSPVHDDSLPSGNTAAAPQMLLAHHLKQIKLPTVLREYEKVARECARDDVDHPRYLLRLIELELIDCERRTVERRIRATGFPAVQSFDFTAILGLNKMRVLYLARYDYMSTSIVSGGDRRSHRIEAWSGVLLAAIEVKADISLVKLAEQLQLATEHGGRFAPCMI